MARSTAIHLVLPAVLCFATNSLAAETGMLYAKSDPPGAIVVIGGKERGKTPVLVRGLPAGDITVELRFPGAKPVMKQATVEANKVITIDVAIEVPSATLTIVSEPLEATVILDGRDVGKTPTTLEDLQPGPHELILLKDGHPRTARSVVLGPGAERVLEVKLGTAGGDETVRPAGGQSGAQAAKSVPVEVQQIFTMLKDTVAKGNHSETRRNLALALSQPDMANFKEELCAAIRVVQELETRQRHVRKGAEALVGKEITFKTKTGARKGRVEGVSVEGITLASKIIIDGRAVGQTRATIKWSALAQDEQDRLAGSWKPEGLDGAVARAVLAFARKDKAGAERAATAAGDHALGKYLGAGSAAGGPAEDDPKEAWAPLEKRCSARRITAAEEMALDREIRAFKDRYGKAGLDPSLRRRMSLAGKRAKRASGLVGHWTFDEGDGSVARDWSARGHHGRIQGGARWVKGRIGGALAFDGNDDYVSIPNEAAFDITGNITVAAWIKVASFTKAWQAIVTKGASSWRLQRDNTKSNLEWACSRLSHNSRSWLRGSVTVDDGRWHHVAGVYDGTKMWLYVDGSVDASVAASGRISVNNYEVRIGERAQAPGTHWNGLIDDVRIYIRALSAEEVKALAIQGE